MIGPSSVPDALVPGSDGNNHPAPRKRHRRPAPNGTVPGPDQGRPPNRFPCHPFRSYTFARRLSNYVCPYCLESCAHIATHIVIVGPLAFSASG
ncbi:hypothetical protein SBA1_910038 [Candidatus Sulfotelmatobacter kueseliae]|uniref:Uncharacterized protein n=1 Tax=Candidatus Sulfotelmatobacter kueseliae TaxID=2042962 RepID=A0A2U3LCD3_9BACT|nr:hypothetical protein SBA1_910038 [Candidatus Sulfotelmatobacter kueseliae]